MAEAQTDFTVVMSGLNNPRGLAFGQNGGLYVTEAGSGGGGASIVGANGDTESYGATGGVSLLLGGVQSRVLSGAPSLASQAGLNPGNGATGLNDIAFFGSQAYGVVGFVGNPALRSSLGAVGDQFAQVVRLSLDGSNTIENVADLGLHETNANPDAPELNSNPFSLAVLPSGALIAVDAGGNDLLGVTPEGAVSTLSVVPAQLNPLPFGPPFYQAVPTGVAVGADGAYYFGELTGVPFPVGGADIYRYDPLTGIRTVAYSGFTNLIDLAFAPDGSLYALQLTTNGLAGSPPGPGLLTRIGTDGTRTVIENQRLFFPTALAIGLDNAVYVSNQGIFAGGGQVVRITTAAPEPGSAPLLALGGLLSLIGYIRKRTNDSRRQIPA